MRLLALVFAGCPAATTDPTGPTGTPTGSPPADSGWCAVTPIFNGRCVVCHNSAAPQGDLDLEADPHGALVGVTSAAFGAVLVKPGDPDGSLLMRKLDGAQAAGEGAAMPPTGLLSEAERGVVRDWIADGASDACDVVPTGTVPVAYHPEGWEEPGAHGLAAKLQQDDCQSCHGEDLTGGSSGTACATCHDVDGIVDWTTTCTYCHGDPTLTTADAAAPPQDIDDTDDVALISFPAHRAHLLDGDHPDWTCAQCHVEPADVFTAGHLFDGDDTPGAAEVLFTGLFVDGAYDAATSTCSGGYCHSSGVDGDWTPRTVAVDATLGCASCHAGQSNPVGLTGEHANHVQEGVTCDECHATVAPSGSAVDEPDLHVNGAVDVDLPAGMTRNEANDTCSGTCHGELHQNRRWFE